LILSLKNSWRILILGNLLTTRKTPTSLNVMTILHLIGAQGLDWLLEEALRAYWCGADAAAICMRRALTEEVVEKHYLDQNEIVEIMSRSRSAATPLTSKPPTKSIRE
jgi:hypothetical protein